MPCHAQDLVSHKPSCAAVLGGLPDFAKDATSGRARFQELPLPVTLGGDDEVARITEALARWTGLLTAKRVN